MTTLLMPEKPIAVLPGLAVAVGLNEAIFLQQLHYWLNGSEDGAKYGRSKDGHAWVYNDYAGWQAKNFPFWSVSTVRRVAASLDKQGLIITEVEKSSKFPGGRRKWYRIDREAVEKIGCVQNEQTPLSKMNIPSVQNEQSYITETTTETTNRKDSAEPEKPVGATPQGDAVQSDPPAKPKRKTTPRTLDNLNPIQAVIAYRAFGVQLQQVITGRTMTRVNMVAKELRTRWQNGDAVEAGELKAALLWHVAGRGEAKKLTAPRDPVAVAAVVQDYRDMHGGAPRPALPPPDPDCPTCGGTGLTVKAGRDEWHKETVPCVCRTQEAADGS